MLNKKTALLLGSGIIFAVGVTTSAFAETCPTKLQRDAKGFWSSDSKPGWKSHRATKEGITVETKKFGGVVYSPKRHRLACVFKASNGKWIALVSDVHKGIIINKDSLDVKDKAPAWKFSKKHQDYACGRPSVSKIERCSFKLND